MLNFVRQHAESWLVKSIIWMIVFAFVGTIFYSWGMGGSTGSRGGVVATVEGVDIEYSEYDKTFNNMVNFYREQFKSQFSEDLIQRLDLKTQALDALIQRKLLLLESGNLNIKISDEEVIDHIQSFPAFQKDKIFNKSFYTNYLKFNRLSPLDFEESQREALMIQKLERLITGNTLVSKSEVLDAFNNEEETTKLDYIAFSEDQFKDLQAVTDENLKKFFEENKSQFEVPDQIQVEYIKVSPKDFESDIELSKEDIQDFYETNVADFRVKKQYTASHILFQLEPSKIDEKASVEEKQEASEDAAKTEAEQALKKIKDGADFAKTAEQLSDDPSSASKGGSLGDFVDGTMVPEFEEALNKLKVGEISEPVKSPFGYHIIRLDGKQEARVKPLSEVKDTVVAKAKETKSRQKARRIVKQIYKAAGKGSDFSQAAAEQKIVIKTSDFFSRRNHNIPDVGAAPEFFNTAFILADGQISEPINTLEASFVLKVKERKPAAIPELDSIREKVKEAAQKKADKDFTEKRFKELAAKLISGNDLDKIAQEVKLEIRHTPFFSRVDSIPGIGDFQNIKDAVFPLEKGQVASASAFRKHYLLRVQDRKMPDAPTEDQIETITARLKRQKSTTVFNDWLKNLREKSNILIDKTLL
ncbi:MAG: SurA N-terminal domain-containing protein [Nitrospinae bacterium]|nr:SurA N-terminal domain-containing protein [Nitrospinota bacterium]